MRRRDGKRSSLFVLPLLFVGCSLILNDLPEPVDDEPSAGGGGRGGGTATNQGGKSAAGTAGLGNAAGSNDPAGGVGVGGTSAPVGGEGGENATVLGGAAGEASTSEGGSGGSGCPCDCDKDGALNDGCHMGGGPADCDDSDEDVKPGQTAFFDAESNGGTFDYNCDEDIEREFGTLGMCPLIMVGECEPEEGFESLVECGQDGSWTQCDKAPGGLSCEANVLYSKTMRCR